MNINKAIKYMLILLSIISGTACERRLLEEPDNQISVKVDVNVENILNVTTDVYNSKITLPEIKPEMMRVLFYNPENGTIAAESYISDISYNEDGTESIKGDIKIIPGTYNMVIYNFDTESTMIRNDSNFATIEAYTDIVSTTVGDQFKSKADNTSSSDSVNVIYEPDYLMMMKSENEVIPYHEKAFVIKAEVESVVQTYYLQIKVKGLEYVSSAQAVVSGMAGSYMMGKSEVVSSPESAIYFTMQKSQDNGEDVIAAVFNTFGKIDGASSKAIVNFDINTVDGRTEQRSFDIAPLFETEDCIKHHWLLMTETITIDPPTTKPGTGGGFNTSVGDWDDEDHSINL
ncbi:MAG: DUF5119 domain-containing protein [Bacteroidales bacterium]|jgi:hypothetical protein|nr:DUF5119 domain-containing protein [Bacteroidales bacterium]